MTQGGVQVVDRLALAPGQFVNGRYLVERLLGQGGLGMVYLARDMLKGNVSVALKILARADLPSAERAMLLSEFKVMTRLRHPNVASAFDLETLEEHGIPFITMEYVEGQSIDVAARGASWQQVTAWVVSVCRGLAYMHNRSVVHFDLKPANIMVTSAGDVKILDFGLAGARAHRSGTSEIVGSPAYMAPELILALPQVDHRADLYSLGVILYELLTGRHPFEGETLTDVLRAHCASPIEFDEDAQRTIPAWLRRVVIRLMAKDPSDRFRTATEVIETINREGGFSFRIETAETKESYVLSSRFVARQAEFHRVVNWVKEGLKGQALTTPVLFVVGASGIGKSRLLREVRYQLQLSRRHFVDVCCYEESLSEFAPITEAIRHVVTLAEATGQTELIGQYAEDLGRLDPIWAQRKGWQVLAPANADKVGQLEQQRLVQRLAQFIVSVAQKASFVLCVNDLHWARRGTVEVLKQLARDVAALREAGGAIAFCLLGSYRNDEVAGRPIADLRDTLLGWGMLSEVELTPLSLEAAQQMAASMLGWETPPAALVERIWKEGGGNPYFIEEIMRSLLERGQITRDEGGWIWTGPAKQVDLPHSVTDALLRRYAVLDEKHRTVLDVMAVHGEPLSVSVLSAALGVEPDDLQERLSVLLNRQMVLRTAEMAGMYRLVHDRLRESVYDSIPEVRRRALHSALARGLLALYAGQEDEVVYHLARHFWEAGADKPALEYSLRAGLKAYREYANELGIRLFRRVLELLPEDADAALRNDIFEKLGDMCRLIGSYDEGLAHYQEVLEQNPPNWVRARMLRKQGLIYSVRGQLLLAQEKFHAAVRLAGGEIPEMPGQYIRLVAKHLPLHVLHRIAPSMIKPVRDEHARLRLTEMSQCYAELIYVDYFINPMRSLLLTIEAVNLNERLGESPQLCHTYAILGVVYATLSMYRSARRYGLTALEMSRRLKLSGYYGEACSYWGMSLFLMGRFDDAMIYLERGEKILRECGDLLNCEICSIHMAFIDYLRGRFAAAAEHCRKVQGILRGTDAMLVGKHAVMYGAAARAKVGNIEGALAEMENVLRFCEETNDYLSAAGFPFFYADVLLDMGEIDKAIAALEKACRIRDEHYILQDYTAGLDAMRVRAYWERHLKRTGGRQLADPDEQRLLNHLSRKALWGARLGHPNYLSPGYLSRGIAYWATDRSRQALRYFRRALEIAQSQRLDRWLADGYFEAGRCLIMRADTFQEGWSYLHRAEKLFEDQGQVLMLRRTRDLLSEKRGANHTTTYLGYRV